MNIRKLSKIITGLKHLADAQDTSMPDIVDALVGVCFNEEEAGRIKSYINDEIRQDFAAEFDRKEWPGL